MVAWQTHAFARQNMPSTAITSAGHFSNALQTSTAAGTTSANPALAPTFTVVFPAPSALNG